MNHVWWALLVAAIGSGCGGREGVLPGGAELAAPPPAFEHKEGTDDQESSDPSMPELQGSGTSAGNPILDDSTAGGSIPHLNQDHQTQWQFVPFDNSPGKVPLPDEKYPTSGCPSEPPTVGGQVFLIGEGPGGDSVIDLYDHLKGLLGPLELPLASPLTKQANLYYYPPYPYHVATDPKGGVIILLSASIPFHGIPCQFFALHNTLNDLTCIDPEATDFGVLPASAEDYLTQDWDTPASQGWKTPTSQRRRPIQFDAEGNVYYRLIPPRSDCELPAKDGLNPLAQIRRWDRKTGDLGTYPLGTFLPFQFQVLKDGALIVTGYEMAKGAGDAMALRYVLPDGTWHQLGGPVDPMSFLVVDEATLLVRTAESLMAVPFGPGGFGAPSTLVKGSEGLVNAAGDTFGTKILYAQSGPDGALYAISKGGDGWFLFDPRAIVKVAPPPPSIIETSATDLKFFRIVGDQFFVVGMDEAGKRVFFAAPVASPAMEVDLLGPSQHNVTDFLLVGDHLYFASGYLSKGPSYELGRIDLLADPPASSVEILSTATSAAPTILPIWPMAQDVLPLPPTDLTGYRSFPQVSGVGCPDHLPEPWPGGESYYPSHYLINMAAHRDTGFDLEQYLETAIWPEWGEGIYTSEIVLTHVATHPATGVVFQNWRSVEFGDGWCDFFRLDPSLQQVQCIDKAAIYTHFGLVPEPWGQPPSLRRSPVQFDAAGNVYYRAVPYDEDCESGIMEALGPHAVIRRWDRITGEVTTYPLGDFLPLRFHVLADGGLIVSGFDRTGPETSQWPVLWYVLPDGSRHELALPSLGQADLPFHVTDDQTVLIPLIDPNGVFEVPFGPSGFGTPVPLLTEAEGLGDEAGDRHWGLALAAPQVSGNERYVLDRGRPAVGAWWSGRNAILRLTPGKSALKTIPIPNPRFFRAVGNHFYIVGDDMDGNHRFIRTRVVAPTQGLDLLDGANIFIHDFLIRDQQIFFTGYQEGDTKQTDGPRLGRIDMAADNALTILAHPEETTLLHPYWPKVAEDPTP